MHSKNSITKSCKLCGKEFHPHSGRVGRFCSLPCFRNQDIRLRFWEKVNKNGPISEYAPHLGNCWLWKAAIGKIHGYGVYTIKRKNKYAHAVAYEFEKGTIPNGMECDHLCRVRACVRPSHIEPVTHYVNWLRGHSISSDSIRKTHCVNGHPFDEVNTHIPERGGRQCRRCSRINRIRSWSKYHINPS